MSVRQPYPVSSGGGADLAIGSAVTDGTEGLVLHVDSSGNLAQDANFKWDDGLTLKAAAATDIPLTLQGATSQSGNYITIKNSAGTIVAQVEADGTIRSRGNATSPWYLGRLAGQNGAGIGFDGGGQPTFMAANSLQTVYMPGSNFTTWANFGYRWGNKNNDGSQLSVVTADTGLARNAAGIVEINNGTAGTLRDLSLRNQIYGTPDTDHTSTGPVTSTFNAGATITVMDLVYMASDGEWALTDADAASTATGMLAISLESKTDGNAMKVALTGSFVRDDTWAWTPGAILYVDTATPGAITATAPSGSADIVRVVGHAVSADVIFFNPSGSWVEIG